MGFVNDEECVLFILVDAVKNLKEHAIFADFRFFTEACDHEPEKGIGVNRG